MTLTPFMNIGPGEFIKEEMELRDWNNEDLAQVLKLTPKTISLLLNNKQKITIETASLLSKAFGQSPQYWLNLDNNYRLRLESKKLEDETVKIRSKIYEHMPINEMVKKRWIQKPKSIDELEKIFISFWQMKELEFSNIEKIAFPHCRKSEAFSNFNRRYILTWTRMARNVSESYSVGKFNKSYLEKLAIDLPNYTIRTNGIKDILTELNNAGVKFFILSHLSKTYLDGASFYHGKNPILVYTIRYDRTDNFWFTLAHEIGHILLHIKDENDVFVDDLKSEAVSSFEKEANEFAENILYANKIISIFSKFQHYTSAARVLEYANTLKISPAVITGILKHNNMLAYNRLNQFTPKVSELIPSKYFVEK